MKASNPLWKTRLSSQIPEDLAREIDIFETEIYLRKQGKLERSYLLKNACGGACMASVTIMVNGIMAKK